MHIRPSRALGASLVAALTALNVWSPALVSAQCVGGAPNSILSRPPEQCDDGNVAAGDGCTAMCTIEPGWTCAPPIDFVTLNTLDYGSSASWTVSPDGLTGTQTVNTADPTVAIFGADAIASRLEAWGCGELHPTETNDTADGRQANRRVEFHILTPVPPSGARALEGCQQITE